MKRLGLLALIAVLVLGLAIYLASCGGGGGGGGGGSDTINYSSPAQAASSSDAVMGAVVLASSITSLTDMAAGAIPAGYAPFLRTKAVGRGDIASIDPRLKTAVDKMRADLKNPMITGTLAKARFFKTASSTPLLASAITPTTTPCAAGGSYTVSGSETLTGEYDEHTVSVVYSSCQDSLSYPYVVLSGSLNAYDKHMFDNSSDIKNVTATQLTIATYMSSTVSSTNVLTGTFNESYAVSGTVMSGRCDVNGSIQETSILDSTVITATVGLNNISDVWSSVTTTAGGTVTTDEHTYNGSVTFDVSSGGNTFTFALTLSNLTDKLRINDDSSEDWWINGSVSMNWSPNPDGGACLPGTLVITTGEASPIHTEFFDDCPSSGTVTLNNATIQFGVPAGSTGVLVTVGTSSLQLSDCYELGGNQCIL